MSPTSIDRSPALTLEMAGFRLLKLTNCSAGPSLASSPSYMT
jgi:hypothetical protein